jgi:hypothetical protein
LIPGATCQRLMLVLTYLTHVILFSDGLISCIPGATFSG